MAPPFLLTGILGRLIGANMNSTGDQSIPINASKYIVRRIVAVNPSINLTTAAGGIYTAIQKGGTALVPAVQVYKDLTAAAKFKDLTLDASLATDSLALATLYLSLTTGQGASATCDFYVIGDALPV